jgi:hypothetical protein
MGCYRSRTIWDGLLVCEPAPDDNPCQPVIAFEAAAVDGLERRVPAGFP